MDKNYEYHKQNDYPGERTAEKKRVTERAEAADNRPGILPIIIVGVIAIMLLGFGWGYMNMQQQAKIDSLNMQIAKFDNTAVIPKTGNVLFVADTIRPFIVQVSPANNESTVGTHDAVTVVFSEPMDASTINGNTVIVEQRTTPALGSSSVAYRSMQLEGTVAYNGVMATFTPTNAKSFNPMQPSQQYGNVFTVTITNGAKDLAGNSLLQNYVWSFTTGGDSFNTDATTSQTG